MNGIKAVHKNIVTEAAARGVCPVCTVLRHRQTRLIEETGIPGGMHLCNHHAWALAKAAPASIATDLLLRTLQARRNEGTQAVRGPCDFCKDLLQGESEDLKSSLKDADTAVPRVDAYSWNALSTSRPES